MNEDVDIALLAHQANMGLNQIYQSRQPQRIDPRQFLNNNYGGQQGRPNFNPSYPPQQQQPYYPQVGGVEDYGLPSQVAPQTSQLPLVMRDRDGNVVDLSQTPSVMSEGQTYPPYQQPNGMNDVRGFQIPDYSKYNKAPSSQDNEAEESTLDIILREIKSLKKAVNKLIRETEKSKLSITSPSQPLDINAINNQSPVISEGIPCSNFGD